MAEKKDDFFNPFANFDMTQFDVNKMLANFNMPGMDMEAMLAAQRKNIEALAEANKLAVEGMQAVAKRQAEILAQAMTEVSSVAQQLTQGGNPQDMSSKQGELVKQAFEKALANMRELAEMVNKSNAEAFAVINKRFSESLVELKSLAPKK